MSNPIFNMLGNSVLPMRGPMGNMMQMAQQFMQFKNTFKGNPQQQVQQLLNSGKVSQEQYNQAVQVAQQLQKFLG